MDKWRTCCISKGSGGILHKSLLVNEKAFQHKIIEDSPESCIVPSGGYFFLAGYCKRYAYLFNYPEDIKPDWKNAIDKCKRLLKEYGYDLITEIDKEKNWGIYIKEARKARS